LQVKYRFLEKFIYGRRHSSLEPESRGNGYWIPAHSAWFDFAHHRSLRAGPARELQGVRGNDAESPEIGGKSPHQSKKPTY